MTIELTASVIVPTTILDTGAFTRSTTATYFDVDGVMQTAAIDVPRIGYDPVTHAHTGLILEAAATNLLVRSKEFDNGSWTKSESTFTANAVTAPDGTTTADKMVESTTASAYHYSYQGVSKSASAIQYTYSIYVKNAGRELVVNVTSDGGSNGVGLHFNPSTGVITSAASTFGTYTGASGSAISIGNGWYRVTLTFTTNTAVLFSPQHTLHNGSSTTYTGDGASGIYLWGAQLETGSTATSYIPTTSAQVTRAADVVTGSGLIYCSTPEPATGETLWDAATSYTVGQVVARTTTHHLYENLIAGVNATLPENATTGVTPRWLDLGATNRWSQFDQKIGTATTSTTSLTTIVKPGLGEGLALLDLIGVTAKISATDAGSGVVIFERTVDLDSTTIESVFDWMFSDRVQKRNVVITDIPAQYPNMVVAVTIESTTGSAIGVFAVGRAIFIGATEYGAGAGIINFGKVTDDGFGNRTWIEGDWANRVTLPMVGNTSDFNRIHRQLATVRSTPCIYIGSALDSMEPLVCYGVFRDLYITVPNYPSIAMNLEIDGMSNS